MANEFHDVKDRLDAAFAAWDPEAPANEASASTGWPVEQADLFVLNPESSVALCTLADLDLARSLAAQSHPQLAVVGPMATENLGVEKLVRNVLTSPAIRTILLVGPETNGSAPTGHYAGDALLCLLENGVDPQTMRIKEARGRRPILKNRSAFSRPMVGSSGSAACPALPSMRMVCGSTPFSSRQKASPA